MAAWQVTAEKAEGQLAVRVKGPSTGPASYAVSLVLVAGGVVLASGTVSTGSAAAALPLAVNWAKDTLDSWKTGLGA